MLYKSADGAQERECILCYSIDVEMGGGVKQFFLLSMGESSGYVPSENHAFNSQYKYLDMAIHWMSISDIYKVREYIYIIHHSTHSCSGYYQGHLHISILQSCKDFL